MKREGDGSSFRYFGGTCEAWEAFMALSATEIARGEKAGARIKWARANPAKVKIGWFERRVIRGEFKGKAR